MARSRASVKSEKALSASAVAIRCGWSASREMSSTSVQVGGRVSRLSGVRGAPSEPCACRARSGGCARSVPPAMAAAPRPAAGRCPAGAARDRVRGRPPTSISSAVANVSMTRSRLVGFVNFRRRAAPRPRGRGPARRRSRAPCPTPRSEELDAALRALDRLAQLLGAAAGDEAVGIDAVGERRRRRRTARCPGARATRTSTSASTHICERVHRRLVAGLVAVVEQHDPLGQPLERQRPARSSARSRAARRPR